MFQINALNYYLDLMHSFEERRKGKHVIHIFREFYFLVPWERGCFWTLYRDRYGEDGERFIKGVCNAKEGFESVKEIFGEKFNKALFRASEGSNKLPDYLRLMFSHLTEQQCNRIEHVDYVKLTHCMEKNYIQPPEFQTPLSLYEQYHQDEYAIFSLKKNLSKGQSDTILRYWLTEGMEPKRIPEELRNEETRASARDWLKFLRKRFVDGHNKLLPYKPLAVEQSFKLTAPRHKVVAQLKEDK